MNTNLRAVFLHHAHVRPIMVQNGVRHIINISSLAGKNPVPMLHATPPVNGIEWIELFRGGGTARLDIG